MSTIGNDIYASLGLTGTSENKAKGGNKDMGQADFLLLMTEQLKHQDPLKPMENSAFLGQLAQFSTVQGIQDLNSAVQGFSTSLASDQVMRGATLVGREVVVPSAKLALPIEGDAGGVVAAPGPGTVEFKVTNANGDVVRQFSVPAENAGEVAYAWDGANAAGQRMDAGSYGITASFTSSSGETSQIPTYVQARVQSVTVGKDGVYLDLPGLGTAPIDYVLRIS